MPKKHFIATHTFVSEEAKADFFEMCKGMSSEEFMEGSRNENAILIQHWMASSDFFFCHWIADSEDAILDLLAADGSDERFNTMCSEMHYVVSKTEHLDDVYAEPTYAE